MPPRSKDLRWWKGEKADVPSMLFAYRERLDESQRTMRAQQLLHARLYGGVTISGLRPGSYSSVRDDSRIKLNIIQSMVDTAASKIAQARPAPQFLTSGADYKERRKAARLNKFGKGMLHASTPRSPSFYEIAPRLFRDGAIFGTGIGKIFTRDKRVCTDRVYPWEIWLDDAEMYYGDPRTVVQRKFVDREVLLEQFGGDKRSAAYQAITKAKAAPENDIGRDSTADQVEVLEGWRLPSGETAKDGRHVIALENICLSHEE